ncbi:nuclear condensing complex subunit [Russula earlei]|uniref:Nuclear condensing complex subunit n=1 Tax=Russula earlei TaxID=71964 RepID=A0ACC0UH26_9AGAM|nr:nuclear condensing complex subunit [Russula earlei]
MPARIPTASILETLASAIPKAFEQAQNSSANHQKNFIALHIIHLDAASKMETVRAGDGIKLVGERAFEDCFIDMINRVLVVKKGTSVADRTVKFVAGYIKFLNAKWEAKREEPTYDDDESTATRFTHRLLKHFLKAFQARDKNVRYRVVCFVAETISQLVRICTTTCGFALMERVRDKESFIRVQAVAALAKICVLEYLLAHDPSADVRRAALLNIPVTAQTLPSVLARTRDVDLTVRRLVYGSVLLAHAELPDDAMPGAAHPRVLTIAQREQIVRNGLGDREPVVRAAAGKLVGAWVDAVGVGTEKGAIHEDLVAFLGTFDLRESAVVEDALLSVFVTRVDVFDALEFDEEFWNGLTPEKAFLVRVFVDHCVSTKENARLEKMLPVVTAHAFRIQSAYNSLLDTQAAVEEAGGDEEVADDHEFVLAELLRLALNLDYADEIGRRRLEQFVRHMISQEALPSGLVTRCLDVLRVLSSSERDLIRVVVEVVHELRDANDDDEVNELINDDADTTIDGSTTVLPRALRGPKPPMEMTPGERERADAMDLRCLDLCIGMLERVNGTFEENSTLEGILGELIVPAVKRKELVLREKGLVCLGLCCLIARRMALNSFQLFLSQVQTAPEVLKLRVLQVVFDVLMVHESDFLANASVGGGRVIEFLLQVLGNEESDKVQTLICTGFAKLMLSGMISDERVLISLALIYLSPDTAENQELRQCLSYFFPAYSYSAPAHQRLMQKVFLPVFDQLSKGYRELDEDQEMVSPAQVCAMFADWTDPQKAIEAQGQSSDKMVHMDMASSILRALFNRDVLRSDKKVLCQTLVKLVLPPETDDDDKVRTLKLLVHNLRTRRPPRDASALAALVKFDDALSNRFEKQLEDFNEAEYRQLQSLQELFEFLDDILPLDEDENEEEDITPQKRPARKRRSESVTTDATSTVDEWAGTPPRSKGGKAKSKRRRTTQSDDEEDEYDTVEGPPALPTRSMPRRAATKKVDMTPIVLEGDDDGEDEGDFDDAQDEEDKESTPVPRSKRHVAIKTAAKSASVKSKLVKRKGDREQGYYHDDDDVLEPADSIMDSGSEREEDNEVDGMLGE